VGRRSVASLSKIFTSLPPDPTGMVSTGSARLNWPGAALEFATIEGDVESGVRFAPALAPARVTVAASAGNWTLHASQELDGDSSVSLETGIRIDPADITRSRVLGTLHASSANLGPVLAELRRAFPDLPDASSRLAASPLTVEAGIEGTLGAPRFVGTATSERLRIDGLPAMRADASFEATPSQVVVSRVSGDDGAGNRVDGRATIDFEAGATTGSLTAKVGNPEPVLAALLEAAGSKTDRTLKAAGSVTLEGEWSGPLDDPAVEMIVKAEGVSVVNSSFGIHRASAEGRLVGPLSMPEAMVRITAGALGGGSLTPVPADAQLSLASGRLEVSARVPDWSPPSRRTLRPKPARVRRHAFRCRSHGRASHDAARRAGPGVDGWRCHLGDGRGVRRARYPDAACRRPGHAGRRRAQRR